jgi:HAD superfamily hydrolase (TIGR01509 family)
MRTDRAVLFDMDGTLVDTERENVESVVRAVRRWNIEIDEDMRRFIVGHSWNEIHLKFQHQYGFSETMAVLIDAAVAEKRALFDTKGYQPLPGAERLVRRLSKSVPLALVSGSSTVEVRETVAGLGLADCFRHLLGSEAYGRGKPHPEPYQTAMRLLEISPEGCIVVEDSEPGILAGKAAGARVIAARRANFVGYDQSAADIVVDTLEDVSDEMLERLWSM